MLKTKDGYAKLIGTTYQGSSDQVLLSNGDNKAISSLSVNYANSAGNADSLDGEHAYDFVRAGNIYSNNTDLNALDTYSFIKSVYSTVVNTSPKGNTGWYNIIQAVYKNGAGDGVNYIGQIALGMTVNKDDMFFRTKNNGSWNPWKTILHDGNSSISGNTIKINNTTLDVANLDHNHDKMYLKLAGGTMDNGARIGVYGNLFIGDESNGGWLYLQDIASQDGTDYWTIYTDGSAEFKNINIGEDLTVNYDMYIGGQVRRNAKSISWNKGREGALLRETSVAGYHTLWSLKTKDGSWDFGEYNHGNDWDNVPLLSYVPDQFFNKGPNGTKYQIKFPLASGTIALTSQISNADVNTAQYLRSLGNQNCQTGRTQAYGDVYTYNTMSNNTDSPTSYTSVIGFGKGTAGTVEIAGGWCNTNLYWRSLRDCIDDWYSWRTVLDSSNYTEFVNNYYWANIKISNSSSTETSPTVHTLTATRICAGHDPEIDNSISCSGWFRSSGNTGWYNTTYQGGWYMSDTGWIRAHNNVGIYTGGQIYSSNSIRMGDIYLQNGNEINNSSSNLYLNYRTSTNINMCHGGGSVIIGPMVNNIGDNKLYVNGSAFINSSTTLNSTVTLNGLVTNNGGILPASYTVNNNGTSCYVWGDAMSTGVTAITDALDPKYVTVNYSQDNGATWTNYPLSNYDKFSLYANNGSYGSTYLGQNRTPDNNGTVSLAQIQKNQLMFTFEIPDSLYSALCWASVDIGMGVQTVCTVEIIGVSGAIENTFTKTMQGWNKVNYINFMWNNDNAVDIGKNVSRFVRFKFKHDASNTAIRNAQIRKIRLFSFTKYYLDSSDFRSIMGNTGHLYKYDENLNVTFPNTLKTTALEVSGNVSFYDLYCNTLNHPSSTGTLIIGNKTQELSIRSSSSPDLSALYLKNKLSSNVCFSANQGFCITPSLEANYLSNRINVNGNTYGYIKVEGGTTKTQTISCLIHRAQIPNVRGLLIDFARGMDGQILILKNLSRNDIYIRPLSCRIILPDSSDAYLTSGNMDTIVGWQSSHFFIYSENAMAWIWFRCN